MTVSIRRVLPILVVLLGVQLPAQDQWMPPQVEQGLVEQLAGRLAAIEPAEEARAGVTARAREAVAAIGAQLGSWTDAVVISKAPGFPQLTMPTTQAPALQAMAGYQMCTMAQFLRVESGQDDGTRRATIVGLTATTMAVLRLRRPFMAGGGTMDQVESFLTSDVMAAQLRAIQGSPALMAHVEQQCQPVIRELVGKAGMFP